MALMGVRAAEGAARRAQPNYFSNEYRTYMRSAKWRRRRSFIIATTLGRDVLLPWLRANHVDHLRYRRMGNELPIFDAVPLSRATHRVVTILRDAGLRSVTNVVLRCAHLTWFLAYLVIVGWVAYFLLHRLV